MVKTEEKEKYRTERDREVRQAARGRLMENAPDGYAPQT